MRKLRPNSRSLSPVLGWGGSARPAPGVGTGAMSLSQILAGMDLGRVRRSGTAFDNVASEGMGTFYRRWEGFAADPPSAFITAIGTQARREPDREPLSRGSSR